MATVYILTLRNTQSGEAKLVKNLGVFQKRSDSFPFILAESRKPNSVLSGGTLKISLDQLKYYENSMEKISDTLLLLDCAFWAVYIEKASLY